MKKMFAVLLAACLLLLFACGQEDDNKQDEATGNASEDTVAQSAEKSLADGEEQASQTEYESSEYSVTFEESSLYEDNTSEESSAETVPAFCGGRFDGRETIKLVALGDSIARGYGLDKPSTQAYPAILAASIESVVEGATVEYENFGIDGLKTSGLLSMLEAGVPQLDNADVVVVCIGANNLLTPFLTAFSGTLVFDPSDVSSDTGSAEQFLDRFNELIDSEEFEKSMNAGIEDAAEDLPRILKLIKERAPEAIIAVTTVYSPYHGMVLSLPYLDKSVDVGEASDRWVSLLNETIRETVKAENCLLVESYYPFIEGENLLNARFSIIPPKFNVDPHPNIGGHIKLSNLYMSAINEKYGQ